MKRFAFICVLGLALAGCGGGGESSGKTLATINSETVTESQVEALLSYSSARAQEEGEDFPAKGTGEYKAVHKKAVDTLVTLVEYDQKADSLGMSMRRSRSRGSGSCATHCSHA